MMSNHIADEKKQEGLVISYFGNTVAVEAESGQIVQCHLRRNREVPVVGDSVYYALQEDETGIVLDIKPRRSLLARGDGRGKLKPVAANIDVVCIVMAPPPIVTEYLIDRYLIAAELLHIPSVIVLNKMDLLDNSHRQMVLDRLAPYQKIPYPVILSSIYIPGGLDELAAFLKNKTGALVGPSGVGKSSIIATLMNVSSIRIGEVTTKGGGKHTTTATRLYHLPASGQLIDSPGVREFNLWPVSGEEIVRSFSEFRAWKGQCKFRDCQHLAEPRCAIKEAVERGEISPLRYESYQTMMENL